MGGLKEVMPADAPRVPRRRRSRSSASRSSPASGRRTGSSRPRSRPAAALGWTLYVAGLVGALLTGALHVPPLLRGLPRRAERAAAASTRHEGHGEGPLSMLVPVGILTVLSTIGGLVVIPGVWEPFIHWIDETAEPLVEPTVAEDYGTSAIAVALGLVGFFLARRAFRPDASSSEPGALARPRAQALLRRALRRALLPARGRARGRAPAERRGAGHRALARRDRLRDDPGRRRGRARPVRPPPHVRRRDRVRGRRPRRRLRGGALSDADDRAHPPPDRRRARRRGPPAPARDDRRARVPRRAHGGRPLDRRRRAVRLRRRRPPARQPRASGSRASGSRTRSASTASRSGSRARRSSSPRPRSATRSGSGATARARTTR